MYLDGMLTLVQIGILTFMLNRIILSTMMLHGLSWNPMKNANIPQICLTIMVPILVLKDIWIHPFLRWQEVRTNEANKFQRENNAPKCKVHISWTNPTLKLKLRNIAHKLSWDHVGNCDVCVHVSSCDVYDHIFRLRTILKVILHQISHKLSWCIASFFLIKWSFSVQIWVAGNPLGNVFLYSPAYPVV